jgi:hypothetical protein
LNDAYAVPEFIPGKIMIGTDGGDTSYGIAWTGPKAQYFSVPLIGMSPDLIVVAGNTLADLVREIRRRGNPTET